MTPARVKGYVVAYDEVSTGLVWTVRVNDPTSTHHGKKFWVDSCHPGTMLTRRGVDVMFKVRPVKVFGEIDLRAVDVAIVSARDDVSENDADLHPTINLLVVSDEGQPRVLLSQQETQEQAQAEHDCDDLSVVAFLRVSRRPSRYSPDVHSMLDVFESLAQGDAGWEALGYLLTVAVQAISNSNRQKS